VIGQTISHYRIVEKLGGGMGEVYRTRDEHLACVVAIKVPPARYAHRRISPPAFAQESRPKPSGLVC